MPPPPPRPCFPLSLHPSSVGVDMSPPGSIVRHDLRFAGGAQVAVVQARGDAGDDAQGDVWHATTVDRKRRFFFQVEMAAWPMSI